MKNKKQSQAHRLAKSRAAGMANATRGRARTFDSKKNKIENQNPDISEGLEEYEEMKSPQKDEEQEELDKQVLAHCKSAILAEFPGVVFKTDLGGPDDLLYLDVFWIPDNKLKEFDELHYRLRSYMHDKHVYICMLSHSVSATKQYYPVIAKSIENT